MTGNDSARLGYRTWLDIGPGIMLVTIYLGLLVACVQTVPIKDTRQLAGEAIERADYQKAYTIIIDDAAAGDAELQYSVATLIANGFGPLQPVDRNRMTLSWLLKSADQGYTDALLWLADAYKNGWLGLAKNPEAEHCWRALVGRFDPALATCQRPPVDDASSNGGEVTQP